MTGGVGLRAILLNPEPQATVSAHAVACGSGLNDSITSLLPHSKQRHNFSVCSRRFVSQGSVAAPKSDLVNLLAGFSVFHRSYAVVAAEIVVCVLEKTSDSLYAAAR